MAVDITRKLSLSSTNGKHRTITERQFLDELEQDGVRTMAKEKRNHKATYARDKQKGGYIIRVEGPTPNRYAGREVPVERRDGSESFEKLTALLWTGTDGESGKLVALYSFEPRPKTEEVDDLPF